jgi:hypothetical protein
MRIAIAAVLFAASLLSAQDQPATAGPTCGAQDVWFNVKLERSQHAPAKPEPGKALVYFVQSIDKLVPITEVGGITTDIGVDGAWVGAVKNNSYFSVSLVPGEHHLCAKLQAHGWGKKPEGFVHFTAEAGEIYYFQTRFIVAQQLALEFGQADRDQALRMISSVPLSISQPKK